MGKKRLTEAERLARNAHAREFSMLPDVKAKRQAREQLPEVRAKKNAARKTDEARARAAECRRKWVATESGWAKAKNARLKLRGFTFDLWAELIKLQGNACAVCRAPFAGLASDIHADHCHEEMRPRGLLCKPCNTAEGWIRKTGLSPEEFGRRMALYLASPPARAVGVPVLNEPVGAAGSKELF